MADGINHASTYDHVSALLAELQANSKTILTLVPSDSEIINVNLNTREIELSTSAYSNFLSISHDHYAETIYFRIPRYYDGVDLSQMACVVEYVNAHGDSRVSPIVLKDIMTEPGYILLGWCIHGDATRYSGTIKFALRFYAIVFDQNGIENRFVYSLRTQQASGKILYGMPEDAAEEESLFSKPLYDIVDALQQASMIYWTNV